MKSLSTILLICLVVLTVGSPGAWADESGKSAPSPPAAVQSSEEVPDLVQTLHLNSAQVEKLQQINDSVGKQLRDERTSLRTNMIAVLTDAQRSRLRELIAEHQSHPDLEIDLGKALGLTSEQMARLKGLHEAHEARLGTLFEQYVGQVKQVLTPEQQAALEQYMRAQATAPDERQ